MEEQKADHAKNGVSSSWIVAFGNPFDGINVVGPFGSSEDAVNFADAERDSRDWWITTLAAPPAKFDLSESLPEGLSPWRGRPGEIEIQDAQSHIWVTLHAGHPSDPIKWRNTITTAIFIALGIDPREMAK